MNRQHQKKDLWKYWCLYTLIFSITAVGCFFPFLYRGRSFVWKTDGGSQYLPYLAYMGQYLRQFFSDLVQGNPTHVMYDLTIGMGDDVGNVIRAHPLDFLSVFVPVRYTEYLYNALIILRLYLGGLSFSVYCDYFGCSAVNKLTGSLVYIFCGHALHLGIMHPTFLSAFIILPLLLLGAEKILRGEKWYLFSFMTFLGFMSNYYFMYMCTIAMAGYTLLRLAALYGVRQWRKGLQLILRLAAGFMLGTAMAAATLLPVIMSMGDSARFVVDNGSENLLYYSSTERYVRWFIDLIFPHRGTGYNTYLNYAAIALPAMTVFISKKRRNYLGLKIGLIIGTVMLLIPFGGYAMAGFSNVTNRWVFIYSFIVALTVTLVLPEIACMESRKHRPWMIMTLLYAGACIADVLITGTKTSLLGLAVLAAVLVCLEVTCRLPVQKKIRQGLLLGMVVVSIIGNGMIGYDDRGYGFSREFMKAGTGISTIEESSRSLLSDIEDDTFYRVDMSLTGTGKENYSLLLGYHSTFMYNSLLNGPLITSLVEQENIGANASIRLHGFGGRYAVENLANVKYYLTKTSTTGAVPYGFTLRKDLSEGKYEVYENQNLLNFGYSYTSAVSQSTYETLTAIEKEMVMLESVVLDTVPEEITESDGWSRSGEILTREISLPEGTKKIDRTDEGYNVNSAKAKLKINYERKAGYECFVELSDFYCAKKNVKVRVKSKDQNQDIALRGLGATYSLGKRSYLVRLGYAEENEEDILKLVFMKKGNYELSSIRLIYVPVSEYSSSINKLKKNSLADMVINGNTITGRASMTETSVMVFSIPWSKGWTLTVDGEKTDLIQANRAYTGALLTEGEHEICLTYSTPGAKAGSVIAIGSWVVYLIMLADCRRRRQRSQ